MKNLQAYRLEGDRSKNLEGTIAQNHVEFTRSTGDAQSGKLAIFVSKWPQMMMACIMVILTHAQKRMATNYEGV